MLLKRILRKVKRIVNKVLYSKDEVYYEDLFIHNPRWNSGSLNEDQLLRWSAIKDFIEEIKLTGNITSILDAGCGNGWLTKLLSDHGKAIGLEPVRAVVRYGRKKYPELQLLAGDLPFFKKKYPFQKFDVIVSSEVIEHIPAERQGQFVSDVHSLLNPGGHAIITTPRKEILSQLPSSPGQPIEEWLSENEVRDLFISNGFEVLSCRRLIPDDHKPLEIYQAWLFKRL